MTQHINGSDDTPEDEDLADGIEEGEGSYAKEEEEIPDGMVLDLITGQTVRLTDFAEEKALLVMFVCAHCPYVVHVQPELARLARDYALHWATRCGQQVHYNAAGPRSGR